MWQTKYALAVPKNFRLGVDLWPCCEGDFLTMRPLDQTIKMHKQAMLHYD